MGFLNNMWQNIQKKAQATSAPAVLHLELNLTLRAVRDIRLFGRRRGTDQSLWEIRERLGVVSHDLAAGYQKR